MNQKYNSGYLRQLEAALRGEVTYIPNPYGRMGKVFNLMMARYILIVGATGSGKTSLADLTTILYPYTYLKSNPDLDVHWEAIYFSLERKQMFKHAKFLSWLIYRDYGMQLSADYLLGWTDKKISPEHYNLIRSFDEEMSDILSHVTIRDGKTNIKTIKEIVTKRANELGVLFRSDGDSIYKGDMLIGKIDKVEETKLGPTRYGNFTYREVEYQIYEHDHVYIPHRALTFVFIILDGINLLGGKRELDEISLYLSEVRDIYGFSPVVVTQQNRALGDVNRLKLHGADLSPQIEDVYQSSQMGFDSDLIIGLFDPKRYKAYNDQGEYMGYKIIPSSPTDSRVMTSPKGHDRFRSVHILKNSFGVDGAAFGMKFLGECNHFSILPHPADTTKLDDVYKNIRKNK